MNESSLTIVANRPVLNVSFTCLSEIRGYSELVASSAAAGVSDEEIEKRKGELITQSADKITPPRWRANLFDAYPSGSYAVRRKCCRDSRRIQRGIGGIPGPFPRRRRR